MYIDELKSGTEITISLKSTNTLDLKTTAVVYETRALYDAAKKAFRELHILFFKPIKLDGKIVSFEGARVKTDISATINGRIVVWENVRIGSFKIKDQLYQFVYHGYPGAEQNRRQSFRLNLGTDVYVKINGSGVPLCAILENISEGGACVAFRGENFPLLKTGDMLDIQFKDSFNLQGFNTRTSFQLKGFAVRVSQEEGSLVVGCKFGIKNPISEEGIEMGRYINGKQREILRKGIRTI